MGFRSNFITEDRSGIEVPEWFVEKYPNHSYKVEKENGKRFFPIVQMFESKFYSSLSEMEIFKDIQKILIEKLDMKDIILILLHECGGITRVKITKDFITGREPTGWKDVEEVEHNYCYGCSDKKEEIKAKGR